MSPAFLWSSATEITATHPVCSFNSADERTNGNGFRLPRADGSGAGAGRRLGRAPRHPPPCSPTAPPPTSTRPCGQRRRRYAYTGKRNKTITNVETTRLRPRLRRACDIPLTAAARTAYSLLHMPSPSGMLGVYLAQRRAGQLAPGPRPGCRPGQMLSAPVPGCVVQLLLRQPHGAGHVSGMPGLTTPVTPLARSCDSLACWTAERRRSWVGPRRDALPRPAPDRPMLEDVATGLGRLHWEDPESRDADGPERPLDGPNGGN
jgi:hypothetical protein